ncbi:hypothetical protein ACSLGF_15475, partial [Bacillus sp. A015]
FTINIDLLMKLILITSRLYSNDFLFKFFLISVRFYMTGIAESTLNRVCFFLWKKGNPKAAHHKLKTFGLLCRQSVD